MPADGILVNNSKEAQSPQCQFFVVRKKRLCRMTVRPGRNYCGEHEPQPQTSPETGQKDTRIPCPNDPKHTCYASKLQKHLSICNAREAERPPYIEPGVNAPPGDSPARPRRPLSSVPRHDLLRLVDKINRLYDEHVKDNITEVAERPIHPAVMEEYSEEGRAESSRRHLRQVSSLLHLAEAAGLVRDNTCYVELGAGKGHLSFHAWRAWCAGRDSRVLLVDRASLRHKRDNKLPGDNDDTHAQEAGGAATRLRADLAHLALHRVPLVERCQAIVGFAKHLCGVATDYALRCVTAAGAREKARGVVIATCCHHRCDYHAFFGLTHLKELGLCEEELAVMLGVVSWGTCGDGRPRQPRPPAERTTESPAEDTPEALPVAERGAAGRRAAALLDWARSRRLRTLGYSASLVRYVPAAVSPENIAILAVREDAP